MLSRAWLRAVDELLTWVTYQVNLLRYWYGLGAPSNTGDFHGNNGAANQEGNGTVIVLRYTNHLNTSYMQILMRWADLRTTLHPTQSSPEHIPLSQALQFIAPIIPLGSRPLTSYAYSKAFGSVWWIELQKLQPITVYWSLLRRMWMIWDPVHCVEVS